MFRENRKRSCTNMCRGGSRGGGAPGARPPKIGKNMIFFCVKSWFFTRNTPNNFFKCAPPNLKSWIRPWCGSMIKVKQTCELWDHTREWCSQPMVGNKPAWNLLMSAGILFSGSIPSKVLKMFKTCNIACISTSTFMNHQSYYLYPSIAHVWFNY